MKLFGFFSAALIILSPGITFAQQTQQVREHSYGCYQAIPDEVDIATISLSDQQVKEYDHGANDWHAFRNRLRLKYHYSVLRTPDHQIVTNIKDVGCKVTTNQDDLDPGEKRKFWAVHSWSSERPFTLQVHGKQLSCVSSLDRQVIKLYQTDAAARTECLTQYPIIKK